MYVVDLNLLSSIFINKIVISKLLLAYANDDIIQYVRKNSGEATIDIAVISNSYKAHFLNSPEQISTLQIYLTVLKSARTFK